HGIQRMGLEFARAALAALFLDRGDDRLTFFDSARGDMNVAKQNIVLSAFMRRHMCHAAGADNKYIAFHWITPQCSDMSSAVSGQTVDVVVKGKIAHDAHGAIGFFHGNRRHIDAVEPILLDHGVARGITNGYTIPDL